MSGARGQASLMMLAVVAAVLVGAAVLFALGAKGRHQRAADLAAISAAKVMSDVSFRRTGFAPTRVTVWVRGEARVRLVPGGTRPAGAGPRACYS